MRLPLIVATLTFACVLSAGVTAPQAFAGQASSSSTTSTASKPAVRKKKHHASKRQISQMAPTPDRITEIQSALARKGYYQGDPNGKWDSNTVEAVQKFQSANGIDSDGKLDAPTLQKLGLGSDIAGVSAPKPVSPGCCLMAPSTPPSSQSTAPAPESNADVAVNSSASAPASKTAEH
jgi:peptidoglycan hydrolase-like protein with peptidoglycan-binding domain